MVKMTHIWTQSPHAPSTGSQPCDLGQVPSTLHVLPWHRMYWSVLHPACCLLLSTMLLSAFWQANNPTLLADCGRVSLEDGWSHRRALEGKPCWMRSLRVFRKDSSCISRVINCHTKPMISFQWYLLLKEVWWQLVLKSFHDVVVNNVSPAPSTGISRRL